MPAMQVCSDAARAERYRSRPGQASQFQIRHETLMVELRTRLAICVYTVILAPVQAFHATDANMHRVEYVPVGRSFSISLRVLGGPPWSAEIFCKREAGPPLFAARRSLRRRAFCCAGVSAAAGPGEAADASAMVLWVAGYGVICVVAAGRRRRPSFVGLSGAEAVDVIAETTNISARDMQG